MLEKVRSLWTFCAEYQSKRAQTEQALAEAQQSAEQMYNSALRLLYSEDASVRVGAVYSIYHLALNNEKYRKGAKVLCAHIRFRTQEEDYQAENKEKPSEHIQTAINLLFKDLPGQEGLYCKFGSDFLSADLTEAYLRGADFSGAHCYGTSFVLADCEGVNFKEANCEYADFIEANCQWGYFREANCQGANFTWANCESADFTEANCKETNFMEANCRNAEFLWVNSEGMSLLDARIQGAHFSAEDWDNGEYSSWTFRW